jgi:predicted acetyltransferase
MIGAEHAAARDRGEVAGVLYASEAPIYGRFGYGAAVQSGEWTIDALGGRVRGEPAGIIEWAEPAAARADVERIYDAHRARQVGEVPRKSFRFDYMLGLREWPDEPPWRGRLLLHRDPSGTPDGYARYTAREEWQHGMPRYAVAVQDLHTANHAAWMDLWRYLVGLDFVSTVKADHRAVHEPLPWILENGRHAVLSGSGDGMYVSLLDVRAALAARAYELEDALVLEVVGGPWGPETRERVRLDAGPHGASATATDASPDLTLRASALGAAYLGAGPLTSVVLAGGADEHTAGALARASRLFATIDQPWCSTFF